MKITKVISHVLRCDLSEVPGYSQQYYRQRTAHLVEVPNDEGITGWGERFGPGNLACANQADVQALIQPKALGMEPNSDVKLCTAVRSGIGDTYPFQIKDNTGRFKDPKAPGISVTPDRDFIDHFRIAA
ncbi:hypothetical protein [Ruegeria meonggei]|uniref:Uncharacterized protein n=1 Tax=Ruegeria meonggei TaxID=1446476 RepID=A0A1X6YUZ7_9RHOB|nr:hypothetical protein [Ruegeria meonggei]SLN32173.1 hypothetical protein RUM8411_01344 [Ruegeria meonggei]